MLPDFKTIVDFRCEHSAAIQAACRRYVIICRNLGLIAGDTVAVATSGLPRGTARDRSFTPVKIRRGMEQVDAGIKAISRCSTPPTGGRAKPPSDARLG